MLYSLYISKLILNPKFGNAYYSKFGTTYCNTIATLLSLQKIMLVKKYEFIFYEQQITTKCNTATTKKYQVLIYQ
jgi:hypothetical protein